MPDETDSIKVVLRPTPGIMAFFAVVFVVLTYMAVAWTIAMFHKFWWGYPVGALVFGRYSVMLGFMIFDQRIQVADGIFSAHTFLPDFRLSPLPEANAITLGDIGLVVVGTRRFFEVHAEKLHSEAMEHATKVYRQMRAQRRGWRSMEEQTRSRPLMLVTCRSVPDESFAIPLENFDMKQVPKLLAALERGGVKVTLDPDMKALKS